VVRVVREAYAGLFESAFESERLCQVDPHTGITAKLLDEGIRSYQGIGW